MTKAFELSGENKLLKRECDLYATRIAQLTSTVDSVKVYVAELQWISSVKDTIISNDSKIIANSEKMLKIKDKQLKTAIRKGRWKAIGYGIGGFSFGLGVGVLIGVLR